MKNFCREAAVEAAEKALKIGVDPVEAIEKGLTKGLREVGDLFGKGEPFITHARADPAPYGTWKDKGAKSVVDVAKEILATHKPTLLDRDVKKRLAEIIKEGEKGIPH